MKFISALLLVTALTSVNAFATSAWVSCVCTTYHGNADDGFSPETVTTFSTSMVVTPAGEKYVSQFTRPNKANTLGFWLGSNVFAASDAKNLSDRCKAQEEFDPSLAACAIVVPAISQWEK